MSDVQASDHLLVIVNDVLGTADPKLGGGEAGGVAEQNGKVGYIEYQKTDRMISGGLHELGHTMGLLHASPKSSDYNNDPMGVMGQKGETYLEIN